LSQARIAMVAALREASILFAIGPSAKLLKESPILSRFLGVAGAMALRI
jgi:hypothetical protein